MMYVTITLAFVGGLYMMFGLVRKQTTLMAEQGTFDLRRTLEGNFETSGSKYSMF